MTDDIRQCPNCPQTTLRSHFTFVGWVYECPVCDHYEWANDHD